MALKQLSSHILFSENEDTNSTFSEDIESAFRTPSPDNKLRYNIGKQKTKTSDLVKKEITSSSFATTTGSIYNKSIDKKSKTSSGYKNQSLSSSVTTRNTKPIVSSIKDTTQARLLSARNNEINILSNELFQVRSNLEELIKENKLLKILQHRQEKALYKFEDEDGDLPQLLFQQSEEKRILKIRLRKRQESEKRLGSKVRNVNDEVKKMELTLKRLKKIVYDKNLGEQSELTKKLHTAQDNVFEFERKNKELENKLALAMENYSRQVREERTRHTESKKELRVLQDKYISIQAKLKEKERAMEVSNIYSMHVKRNSEKSFVHPKSTISSYKLEYQHAPAAKKDLSSILTTQPEQKLMLKHAVETSKNELKRTTESLTKMLEMKEKDSVLEIEETTNSFEIPFRLSHNEQPTKEEDNKPEQSSFITTHLESSPFKPPTTFNPNEMRLSYKPTSLIDDSSSTSPAVRENLLKPMEEKKNEHRPEESLKLEQERQKKASLLAKMKDLDNDSKSTKTGGRKKNDLDDISQLFEDSFNKKSLADPKQNQNLQEYHSKVEKHQAGPSFTAGSAKSFASKEKVEISFGGYAPTVTVEPERKQSRNQTDSKKSDAVSTVTKSIFDPPSGKNEKSDLLHQLFGAKAVKPLNSNEVASKQEDSRTPRKSSIASKVIPRAKPIHTGYPWERDSLNLSQRGSGDGFASKQTRNVVPGTPAVKPINSFNDEDLEEITL